LDTDKINRETQDADIETKARFLDKECGVSPDIIAESVGLPLEHVRELMN
jgi:hypothetical protein